MYQGFFNVLRKNRRGSCYFKTHNIIFLGGKGLTGYGGQEGPPPPPPICYDILIFSF